MIVFQDTSVLVNFHRAGLIGHLQHLANIAWTITVSAECRRKEGDLNLPGLAIAAQHVLGDPIVPNDEEHKRIRINRQQMASPGDHPDEHLGEAETIAVIQARRLRAAVATDDRSAHHFASPILCLTTWDVARLLITGGRMSQPEAEHLWRAFTEAGGVLPPAIRTMDLFDRWLASNTLLYA